MSGVTKMLAKRLTQTAVYWANPVNDGYGKYTFDDPIEINCRWEDKLQVLTEGPNDEKLISRSIVFVDRVMKINEVLWLGSLDDLDSSQEADPTVISDMSIVKRYEGTPALGSTTEFMHKVFLTPWLS